MNASDPVFARAAMLALVLAGFSAPAQAACDWPAAKKDIENILDRDAAKGAEFRAATKAGRDSHDAIEKLVDAPARDRIRECAWQAGEFLTQRGFPPLH